MATQEIFREETSIQEILAMIWCHVLNLELVGVEDNFFDLGGNSIAAINVMQHVRNVFGVQFPFPILFGAPTVAELAKYVQEAQKRQIEIQEAIASVKEESTSEDSITSAKLKPSRRSPRYAHFLLLLLPQRSRGHLLGDLEEEYRTVVLPGHGPWLGWCWYWWQTLCVIWPYLWSGFKRAVGLEIIWKVIGR